MSITHEHLSNVLPRDIAGVVSNFFPETLDEKETCANGLWEQCTDPKNLLHATLGAAKGGNLALLKYLLEEIPTCERIVVWAEEQKGFVVPHKFKSEFFKHVGMSGDLDMFNYVLDRYSNEEDPIFFMDVMEGAASEGHIDLYKKLQSMGGDFSPLHLSAAAKGGHLGLVKELVESQPIYCLDVVVADLAEAGATKGALELAKGPNVFPHGRLNVACIVGDLDLVKRVVKADSDQIADYHLVNGLGQAILGGHVEVAEYLIDRGVGVPRNAMKKACAHGSTAMIEALVSRSAPSPTPIDEVCEAGRFELVPMLLSYNMMLSDVAIGKIFATGDCDLIAQIKGHPYFLSGAMIGACMLGSVDLFKAAYAISPETTHAMFDYAAESGNPRLVRHLLDEYGDVMENDDFDVMFKIACLYDREEVVEILWNYVSGRCVHQCLWRACEEGKDEIAYFIAKKLDNPHNTARASRIAMDHGWIHIVRDLGWLHYEDAWKN